MLPTAVRTVARLLTGSTFVVLGGDALREPGGRVGMAGPTLEAIRKQVPLTDDDELLVRVNGAVQAAAGGLLAIGLLPRVSALALTASMIPTTIAGHAFWKVDDPAERKLQKVQFQKNMAMLGGLLMFTLPKSD